MEEVTIPMSLLVEMPSAKLMGKGSSVREMIPSLSSMPGCCRAPRSSSLNTRCSRQEPERLFGLGIF